LNNPEVTIECRDLSKSFDGVHAVEEVSVEFEAGKITALIGPNGAGKTTLFHLMGGSLVPDSGEVLLRGSRISGRPSWEIARLGVGRLFQDVRAFGRLSVLENVLAGFRNQAGECFWKAVLVRPVVARQERDLIAQARHWIEFVGLGGMEEAPARALSYGQQKLLALARLLAQGAQVLLLDEPTAGVNPAMVKPLLALLRELARQGKTIVLIEHNMSVVIDIADWVYFMDEGQIVAFGLPHEVLGDKWVREAYLGL
jgi:ABC-type branched-subunit amino acid transport system ATPase component